MGVDFSKAENIVKGDWAIASSEKYYGLKNWGKGHFQIDEEGYLKFRGFKGRYLVSISHAKEETFDIDLSDRTESVITLT